MATKKYYETDSFKALSKEWEDKLNGTSSGPNKVFDDIEPVSDEYVVQPQIFKNNKVQSPTGLDYYEYCQMILREYNFERDVDQAIFEQHAEGKSVREIEDYLKRNDFKPLKKTTIQEIIDRIKSKFGRA